MTTHLCIHGDLFTQTRAIVDWIAARTGWPVVSDPDLIEAASQRSGIPKKRLTAFMNQPGGALNRLTHGTERAMAFVQSAMADKLGQKTTIFHGSLGVPSARQLPQVVNVLVTAASRFRVKRACRARSLSERQARSLIRHADRRECAWCRAAFDDDRFDTDAYDMVIPSDRLATESAGRLILEQLMATEMRTTARAAHRLADLKLSSAVWVQLAGGGYPVSVAARNGCIRLTVERPVLFLNRLAKQLNRQALQVKGVRQVQVDVGTGFFQTDIYRRCRFALPPEASFASYVRCRQRLHDNAAACFPSAARQQTRQVRINAAQQLTASASP